MMKNIYPTKLEEFIMKNSQYVPRLMDPDDKQLKLYHRYWFTLAEQYGKVQEVYKIEDIDYYTMKFPESLFGSITFPEEEIIYELLIDKNNLKNINIINTRISYSGAQIRYWFFLHKDELGYKYKKFWSFIDPNSKSLIIDNKYYFLYANLKDDIYKNCKVVMDKSKNE